MSTEEVAIAQEDAPDAAPSAQGEAIAQRADGAEEQAEASGKRSKRTYSRHGLTALRQRVKLRGLNAIDRRTAAAQELLRFRAELLSDLGGEDHASAAQKKLVELACRTALFLNHIDGWLAAQPSLVRKRTVLPALRERQQLADSLARYLSLLGLERRAKPALGGYLNYLKARQEGSEAATGPSRPSDDKDPYSGRRKRSPGRIAREEGQQ
jgi:hypothetical protein